MDIQAGANGASPAQLGRAASVAASFPQAVGIAREQAA